MKKTASNSKKMTRALKKKAAFAARDQQTQELSSDRSGTPVEAASKENASEAHPLFLSAQHNEVYRQLMDDLSSTSRVCWLNFASALLKDHYIELMKPQLRRHHQLVVELSTDQNLVELINQLITGVPLEQAMKTRVSGQASKLMLIRCPEQLEQESWDLLFILVRDFPALNIAYLLCWSDGQQKDSQLLKSLRTGATVYDFGLQSTLASDEVL